MSSRTYEISAGAAIEASTSIVLIGVASVGDPSAKRRLVHPDSANFPPLVYFSNPDRTVNLDNVVLPAPITNAQRTIGTTQITRFEQSEDDVIITERWIGADGARASMPTSFFRMLYEYLLNPPTFVPAAPVYIQWEPQDKTEKAGGGTRVYNVELLSLTVGGGGSNNFIFDVADLRPPGGFTDPRGAAGPGAIEHPLDSLEDSPTGLIDRSVVLRFRVVNEVV